MCENFATELDPIRRDVAEDYVLVNKDAVGDRVIAMKINIVVVRQLSGDLYCFTSDLFRYLARVF